LAGRGVASQNLAVAPSPEGTGVVVTSLLGKYPHLGPLAPRLSIDGQPQRLGSVAFQQSRGSRPSLIFTTSFLPSKAQILQRLDVLRDAIRLSSVLSNRSGRSFCLNWVRLLDSQDEATVLFGSDPRQVRIYEQGNYWTQVRRLDGTAGDESPRPQSSSSLCWVSFDPRSQAAFCVGFETEERWHGQIYTHFDGKRASWSAGFDGGDLEIGRGEQVQLEDLLLLTGPDPWDLLERYADLVKRRHGVSVPSRVPVSWCSWYPYRLGVSEEKVLANARIAEQRLKPLGLDVIQVDLGWQKGYLPSSFEENSQFPHGLLWLSSELGRLGFRLGVWIAPFTVSEFDPVASKHPEWLLGGEGRKPLERGEWFWEPHGKVFALDLTHPGAQRWLRERVRGLAQKGVRYLKADFLSTAADPVLRDRHDRQIVAGGGSEALRIGMKIIKEELHSCGEEALLLNCSGPELPGTGHFPLLYACNDTGNTGFVGWGHHRKNYGLNLAGHLFKQGRWGTIQPSCLCVGPPGTIEEARLRATATFLSGGQVDISDDLTVLPEDRWKVLLSTLPPIGRPARPLDLFQPVKVSSWSYEAICRGEGDDAEKVEDGVSRVWRLDVSSSWDTWTLVALFDFGGELDDGGRPKIANFLLPLELLGLEEGERYWAYEFWSGQFLGEVPVQESERHYIHPGDSQSLVLARTGDDLEVSFFGPAVKLLVLRRVREHPWVVGTSFHQSGGAELSEVVWEPSGILRGELNRPPGEAGSIAIAGGPPARATASVAGAASPTTLGSRGSLVLPVISKGRTTCWKVRWH